MTMRSQSDDGKREEKGRRSGRHWNRLETVAVEQESDMTKRPLSGISCIRVTMSLFNRLAGNDDQFDVHSPVHRCIMSQYVSLDVGKKSAPHI